MFLSSEIKRTWRFIFWLNLLILSVIIIGCGTLEVGIEPASRPGQPPGTPSDLPEADNTSLTPELGVVEIPDRDLLEIAYVWAGEVKGECQSLHINFGGQGAIGLCKTSARDFINLDEQYPYASLWKSWLLRFAPFDAQTPVGNVSFLGVGSEEASPAWQRAMAKWGELVWVEMKTEGRSESWDTPLTWQTERDGQPGTCQFLELSTYGWGQASIAPCDGGDPERTVESWLETAEWNQFDEWYYTKKPFSQPGLELFSVGSIEMSGEESETLGQWAAAVFNRLLIDDLMSLAPQPSPTPPNSPPRPDPPLIQTGGTVTDLELGISLDIPSNWQAQIIPGATTYFYPLSDSDTPQPVFSFSVMSPETNTLESGLQEAEEGFWGPHIQDVKTVQLGEFEALLLELPTGELFPPAIWLMVTPSGRAIGITPSVTNDLDLIQPVLDTMRPID